MPLDWFDPEAEASDLYYLLYPELQAAAQVGGTATLMDLAQKGIPMAGFDWSLPNEAAAAWAEKYTFDLVRELTATTRDQLQQAVSTFHATPGMTRGELERLILQGPGGIPDLETAKRFYSAAERAEMISSTEVTRAYSAGNVEAMKALGVEQVAPKEQPPKHVRCRCSIEPFPRDNGVMSWQWHTLADELVCDECGPLNGLDVGVGVTTTVEAALLKSPYKPFGTTDEAQQWANGRFGEWQANLTDAENEAFSMYQSSEYKYINRHLRKGDEIDEEDLGYLRHIDKALAKATVDRDIVAYRGFSTQWYMDHFDELPGMIVQDKGFVSTSLDPGIGEKFARWAREDDKTPILAELHIPKGTHGAYLGNMQVGMGENELLLARDQNFRILSGTIDDEGVRHLVMEVLNG